MVLSEVDHKLRSLGVGSSDAPVIAGLSKWKTIQELWHEKIYGREDFDNWAMARGRALEPYARSIYEDTYGVFVPPMQLEHKDYSFMRANLDGWNKDNKFLIEIKAPGKEDLEVAKKDKIPAKYYPQVQHQLFVTGAKYADYVTYDGQDQIYVKRIWPDLKFQRKLFLLSKWFWCKVQNKSEIGRYDIRLQMPVL